MNITRLRLGLSFLPVIRSQVG